MKNKNYKKLFSGYNNCEIFKSNFLKVNYDRLDF